MEIKWVEKLHKTFHENFKNVVQEFGSHFNVRFLNEEGVSKELLKTQLRELNEVLEQIELSDKKSEAKNMLSIHPLITGDMSTEDILSYYKHFPKRSLCFEMSNYLASCLA